MMRDAQCRILDSRRHIDKSMIQRAEPVIPMSQNRKLNCLLLIDPALCYHRIRTISSYFLLRVRRNNVFRMRVPHKSSLFCRTHHLSVHLYEWFTSPRSQSRSVHPACSVCRRRLLNISKPLQTLSWSQFRQAGDHRVKNHHLTKLGHELLSLGLP